MKVKILQENFARALSLASRFISSRAQLPILENIFLKASKTHLIIASTNLEISVSISIGAQVEREGEITVPGKIISETVANLSPETISLEAEKEQLKIKTSSFSSSILGINSSDFPSIPHGALTKDRVFLSKKDFSEALSPVIFATSTDETRPTLTGVLFIFEKEELTLVATDGFRLSQKKIKVRGLAKNQKVILPKSVLLEFSKSNQEEGDFSFGFNQGEKQVIFGTEDAVFSSRIIEGEFPSFEKIIPKSSTTEISLDKEDFVRAVKLAAVFAREAANVVKLRLEKGTMTVFAENSSFGSQETKIEVKADGEEAEIAFNFRFLEEVLRAAKGEEVRISLSGPASPAVFTDPKDPTFLHLVMPVRLQG